MKKLSFDTITQLPTKLTKVANLSVLAGTHLGGKRDKNLIKIALHLKSGGYLKCICKQRRTSQSSGLSCSSSRDHPLTTCMIGWSRVDEQDNISLIQEKHKKITGEDDAIN
jgi:hypothetical protein